MLPNLKLTTLFRIASTLVYHNILLARITTEVLNVIKLEIKNPKWSCQHINFALKSFQLRLELQY